MIYIDRYAAPVPDFLQTPAVETARRSAAAFFDRPRQTRSQERFRFIIDAWRQLKPALQQLFHGKCAYCESPLSGVVLAEIDHLRPLTDAADLDGRSDPDHYWWLAYEWDNFYLACSTCCLNKGICFPVAGRRAEPRKTGTALDDEKPLLLDPCRDRPNPYLRFREDGVVESYIAAVSHGRARPVGPPDRGRVTINTLGLNRAVLIRARCDTIRAAHAMWQKAAAGDTGRAFEHLTHATTASAPYAAAVRQCLVRWLTDRPPRLREAVLPQALWQNLEQAQKTVDTALRSSAPRSPLPSQSAGQLRTTYMQSIAIRNFRAVRELDLKFSSSVAGEVGWKILLGENGAGKSSVLQATALALLGRDEFAKLQSWIDLPQLLSNGAQEGLVRIELTTDPEPIELRFSATTAEWISGGDGARTMVRGYGATRLLPGPRASASSGPAAETRHVDNLFNPFVPLCDAESWLRNQTGFSLDSAILTLKDLLHSDGRDRLQIDATRILVETDGEAVSFNQLSAGYQSVLGLAIDLMSAMPEGPHDLQHASGIVLLDEIDAHLHPRWKMEIVGTLRRAFPKLQFLVTTHEPLCLRGLGRDEIVVMQRDGKALSVLADVPSPKTLRVDQLLTSRLFGLHSTIDPEIDREFQAYYRLLAINVGELTDEQRRNRDALRRKLAGQGILGYTRRDQLVYEVIDEYLAGEMAAVDEASRLKLREATKARVAEIWRDVMQSRGDKP